MVLGTDFNFGNIFYTLSAAGARGEIKNETSCPQEYFILFGRVWVQTLYNGASSANSLKSCPIFGEI